LRITQLLSLLSHTGTLQPRYTSIHSYTSGYEHTYVHT
jgi:hypothetical protein